MLPAKIKMYHTNASIKHNIGKFASLRPYDFYKGHLGFT